MNEWMITQLVVRTMVNYRPHLFMFTKFVIIKSEVIDDIHAFFQ